MKAVKKPVETYEHRDRLNQAISIDMIVAFSYSGGKRVHIGRVKKITKKRVRIRYTYEYNPATGQAMKWLTDYQADPANILVLDHIEHELTLLALRGVL